MENKESLTYQPKRHRKKLLYKTIMNQIEFYMGDSNLSKDRFICQLLDQESCINIVEFLKFNKIRKLTENVDDIKKAIKMSNILELVSNGEKVKRKTPIKVKQNVDECTLYVENINLEATHDFLSEIFSKFGKVVYVSIPKYKHNHLNKGFAFIEYDKESEAEEALSCFESVGCKMTSTLDPVQLSSIKSFIEENKAKIETDKPTNEIMIKEKEDDYETPAKKIKLDEESECEGDGLDKKRKKKEEKRKNCIKELDFRVLSKIDWKKMRNAYLNLQRKQAKELKKYLHKSKLKRLNAENKVTKSNPNEDNQLSEKNFKVNPGSIVKVVLSEPYKSAKILKSEIKSLYHDVQYVDIPQITSGNEIFLRFSNSESASNFCKSEFNGEKNVLKGTEEECYLKKIEEDRNKKFCKERKKERGKDKLLRKAQNEFAKHKKFTEID